MDWKHNIYTGRPHRVAVGISACRYAAPALTATLSGRTIEVTP